MSTIDIATSVPWILDHIIKLVPGQIGGPINLAVLSLRKLKANGLCKSKNESQRLCAVKPNRSKLKKAQHWGDRPAPTSSKGDAVKLDKGTMMVHSTSRGIGVTWSVPS